MKHPSLCLLLCLGAMLSGCHKEEKASGAQDLSGVWRLARMEHFNGFLQIFDDDDPTQTLRLYNDDSILLDVIAHMDSKGIILIPQNEIRYACTLLNDSTLEYSEDNDPHPLIRPADSIIVIQHMGILHTWVLQTSDEELRNGIIQAFLKDSHGNYAGYPVISSTERKLKWKNAVLLGSLIACAASLAVILMYLHHVKRRRKQVMLQLQKISEETRQRPESTVRAREETAENFRKSDYYLTLHRRIAHGDFFNEHDWEEMERQINDAYPDFLHNLHSLTTPSEVELRTCMLIRLSVPPSDIAGVLHRSLNTISSIRSRMYGKVFGKKGSSRDWDNFILSL